MDTSKIIRGVASNGRYTVTAPIVKEDYGLYLQIEGVELPSSYQVDFSNNENGGSSVTMIGNSDGVKIPRQFIDTGKDVFAFLYWVGEDYGKTVYKFRIPNKVRPDRTNEEPTPEEQSTIDQLIGALNSAVEQTGEDVESASQSAQSAESAKTAAESARDTAGEYANDAESSATSASTSASQASQSATASAQSASQSAQIKADVEDLVDDAQASANASERSASAAYTYATSAERSSVNASASAQSASGYASQAQTSANTASANAQDASQSATTASQKATESAQSASQALSYKTDAESAKTASQTAQGLAESARDSAISAKNDAEQAKADAESARDEAQQAVASISGALAEKAPVITDTASGAVASFSDGADDIPLKSLMVDINPIQDLSNGDPSPENICPISGWTEVDVEQRGKNLLSNVFSDYSKARLYAYLNGVVPKGQSARFTFADKDTSVDISGCNIGFVYNDLYVESATRFRWAINNGVMQSNTTNASAHDATILCSNVFIYPDTEETFNKLFSRYNIMVELSSTATPYEPYTGRSITINLGQTVYGGKLDVLSGVLTVDRYFIDPSQWTQYNASNGYKAYRIQNIPNGRYGNDAMNKPISNMIAKFGSFSSSAMSKNIIQPPRINTDTTYLALQDGIDPTTVELSYLMLTPLTIQLTPNQVNSLLGVNNIWADSGDTEVEYRADTKLYIERLTAPDSADMIADANITSGQYFMVGNSLYKATANIANGSAIIVGTNAVRKSLSEALNEINA